MHLDSETHPCTSVTMLWNLTKMMRNRMPLGRKLQGSPRLFHIHIETYSSFPIVMVPIGTP